MNHNQNFVQSGHNLLITAPYERTASGLGVLRGSLFGVTMAPAANGAEVVIETVGVHRIAKTATKTFAVGAKAYWDDTAKSVTDVASTNYLIGIVTEVAAGGDADVAVRLDGIAVTVGA